MKYSGYVMVGGTILFNISRALGMTSCHIYIKISFERFMHIPNT